MGVILEKVLFSMSNFDRRMSHQSTTPICSFLCFLPFSGALFFAPVGSLSTPTLIPLPSSFSPPLRPDSHDPLGTKLAVSRLEPGSLPHRPVSSMGSDLPCIVELFAERSPLSQSDHRFSEAGQLVRWSCASTAPAQAWPGGPVQ